MQRPAPWVLALCLMLIWSSRAWAEIRYTVEIAGVDDKAMRNELEANSELLKLKERLPASETALRRRAETDVQRLKQIVEAAGYWAAEVGYDADLSGDPAQVVVNVTLGPRYTLDTVAITTSDGTPPPVIADAKPERFGLKPGDPAISAAVLDAEPKIVEALTQGGYPLAKVASRKVVVDHAPRTMSVTYVVEAGPPGRFGATTIDGLQQLERGYVERRIVWQRGANFDSRQTEETRKLLVESGLFSVVRIEHPTELTPDGELPINLTLVERLPRSVGAGLSYDTSEGFGARAFWEHRNLFGGAEKLRFSLDLAQNRLGGLADFRKPDFLGRREDSFLASAEIARDTPVAYTSDRTRLFTGLEHAFNRTLLGGAGVQIEAGEVTEEARNIRQTYGLAGLPVYLRRDTSDDLLNPVRGTRASLTVTPYTSVFGDPLTFASTKLTGSTYHQIDDAGRYVIAAFATLGLLNGEARDLLPADKRLYAGGGGSLRGYGYQLAGPLGPDNKPLGGRSLLEVGGELRIKITESIGVVPFVEVGNVYESDFPDGSGGVLYDAGIGFRYYTPIGPLRLDLATPLRRRPGDAAVQLYISIGQAF